VQPVGAKAPAKTDSSARAARDLVERSLAQSRLEAMGTAAVKTAFAEAALQQDWRDWLQGQEVLRSDDDTGGVFEWGCAAALAVGVAAGDWTQPEERRARKRLRSPKD
jgi:hypothetical protein